MKILLAVEEAAGLETFKLVEKSHHDIVGVLTSERSKTRSATVMSVARQAGYEVLPASLVKDPAFAEKVKSTNVDVILNVHSLHIINDEVLRAAKLGGFNLHPGPLPYYAGINSPSWAIFNGETQHGVTLHWMEAGIDTGPIAFQSLFELQPTDTGLSVSIRCVQLGLELVEKLLRTEFADIPKLEQDFSKRKYYGFDVPYEGKFAPNVEAEALERFVRASDYYPFPSPWGTPKARLNGHHLGICGVSPTNQKANGSTGIVKVRDGKVLLATATDWLELLKVTVDGKLLNAADVLSDGQILASPG